MNAVVNLQAGLGIMLMRSAHPCDAIDARFAKAEAAG
jgi:hypothetical protein